jgi:phytoene synthase
MSASATIDEARRHAEATVRKSGTSFGAGMAILPKKRREAMHAIYAFCREVDDIADDDGLSRAERRSGLGEWRCEIDRVYSGEPLTPTGLALVEAVRAFGLPKAEFLMMIEGMEMDAEGPIVAPSLEALLAYTRRVAGAVGLLSMPVFGATAGATSDRFALSLGDALQLTNILRDIADDAAIGRVYLPAELLEKHGAPSGAAGIASAISHPHAGAMNESRKALAIVARDLAEIAGQKFADARKALADLNWRSVRPALLMMGAYEAYLRKMAARGWERVGEPVSLTKAEKLFIAARYAVAPPLSR